MLDHDARALRQPPAPTPRAWRPCSPPRLRVRRAGRVRSTRPAPQRQRLPAGQRAAADGIVGPATAGRLGIWPAPPTRAARDTGPRAPPLPPHERRYDRLRTARCARSRPQRPATTRASPDVTASSRSSPRSATRSPGPTSSSSIDSGNCSKAYQRVQRPARRRRRRTRHRRPARHLGNAAAPAPPGPAHPTPPTGAGQSGRRPPLPLGGCQISTSVRYGTRSADGVCVEQRPRRVRLRLRWPRRVLRHRQRQLAEGLPARPTGSAPTASSARPPAAAWASGSASRRRRRRPHPAPAAEPGAHGLPANSGEGRRVVYHRAQQRIWAVEDDGTVVKTHLRVGTHARAVRRHVQRVLTLDVHVLARRTPT